VAVHLLDILILEALLVLGHALILTLVMVLDRRHIMHNKRVVLSFKIRSWAHERGESLVVFHLGRGWQIDKL
jgi:hypothetical protein